MGSADETEEFAAQLRRLKDRSGRSYGQLAQRAHLSTSTLHRYCNGKAVPVEYGPVERLARLCGASPEELVQLHRRWVRADAMRGLAERSGPQETGTAAAGGRDPGGPETRDSAPAGDPVAGAAAPGGGGPMETQAGNPVETSPEGDSPLREGPRSPLRRWVWPLAALVALAVTVAIGAFAVDHGPGAGGHGDPAAAPAAGTGGAAGEGTRSPSASAEASPSASAKASGKPGGKPSEGRASSATPAPGSPQTGHSGGEQVGAALSWTARSHVWRHGCGHRYLIDRGPSEVPPPPVEQDAAGWADALGAVHGGDTIVEATVRAAGAGPVVIEGVYVRVVQRGAPLDRRVYEMSNGCGGALTPAAFTVNLDAARPVARPQDGFDGDDGTPLPATRLPYQVTPGDPLALRVEAKTAEYDCEWYLEVRWSRGDRSGTLRIDDGGRPFRTSGEGGGRSYGYDWSDGAWRADA